MILKQTKASIYQLEHYLFQLIRFTEKAEFQRDMDPEKQKFILNELFTIAEAISNIRSFVDIPREKPYIGWEVNNPRKNQAIQTLYRFSCKAVVKRVFSITKPEDFQRAQWNTSKRTRKPYKGWWFMELDKYKKKMAKSGQDFESNSLLNYINTPNEKKSKTDKSI